MDDLPQLRKKIDHIDDAIVTLLAKRFAIVKTIGKYKKLHKLPAFDIVRRKKVLQSRLRTGYKKGLSEKIITDIRKNIHKESLRIQ